MQHPDRKARVSGAGSAVTGWGNDERAWWIVVVSGVLLGWGLEDWRIGRRDEMGERHTTYFGIDVCCLEGIWMEFFCSVGIRLQATCSITLFIDVTVFDLLDSFSLRFISGVTCRIY